MSLLDRLGKLARDFATIDLQLRNLTERLNETRQEVRGLATDIGSLRERVTRLEEARRADQAELAAKQSHIEANIAKFGADLERALLQAERRQLPPPGEPNE
jgi:chromosome segregation ATPase